MAWILKKKIYTSINLNRGEITKPLPGKNDLKLDKRTTSSFLKSKEK